MSKRTYILDGYNVIHKIPELERALDKGLQAAREGLIQRCSSLMMLRRDIDMCYIVFDGDSSVIGGPRPQDPSVRTVFTKTGETADDRILAIIRERSPGQIVVVSDDNYVRGNAKAHSCDILSVREFQSMGATGGAKMRRNAAEGSGRSGSKTGLAPHEEQRITDSLKDIWKV